MNIETAGARLKKMRQEKGLSLEDIQKKTKIHLNVLRAIEGDSLSDLNPIYLKGFIKIYCSCLGLDLKDYLGQSNQPDKPVLNAAVGRDVGERFEKKPNFTKDVSVKLRAMKPLAGFKKVIILAVIAVIFIFFTVKLVKIISFRHKARVTKAKVFIPAAPKIVRRAIPKQAANKPSAKNTSLQVKPQQELFQGFTLGVFAHDKSWVSARVDGKVVFHGVLERGRSKIWQAKEKIELSLGDAGAIELQVNDQRFTKLGRRGQSLKNILINKEGLKITR